MNSIIENELREWFDANKSAHNFKKPGCFIRKAYSLIHYLNRYSLNDNKYIKIHSKTIAKILANKVNKPYTIILNALLETKLLFINHKYCKDHQCKGYRLSKKMLNNLEYRPELLKESYEINYLSECIFVNTHYNKLSDLRLNKILLQNEIANGNYKPQAIYKAQAFEEYWVTGDAHGRVHSNLTSLKREFRKCLEHIDGKELIEIDIAAAQPTLLIPHLLQYNRKIDPTYINAINNGSLYFDLKDEVQRLFKKNKTKEQIKTGMFHHIFYTKNSSSYHSLIKKAFKNLYKETMDSINWYHSSFGNSKLATSLQSLESQLVNHVIEQLNNNYPEHFFIRLHDALIVEKNLEQTVLSYFASQRAINQAIRTTCKAL